MSLLPEVETQLKSGCYLCYCYHLHISTREGLCTSVHVYYTSVMIYHRGASLREQHTDLLCTKQDLSHTSTFVDESSPKISRYCIRMPTARSATLNVTTYA